MTKEFKGRVLALRKAYGLTQQGLASLLGIGWVTVSRWERLGNTPASPTQAVIRALEMVAAKRKQRVLIDAISSGKIAGGTPPAYDFMFALAFGRGSSSR